MHRFLTVFLGFACFAVLGCTRPEVLSPDAGLDAPVLDGPIDAIDAASPPDAPADAAQDVASDAPSGRCMNDSDCDDGDRCNGTERCEAALCVPGKAIVCDDANPCTDDSCSPDEGCVATPVPGTVCFEDRASCRRSVCDPEGRCPAPSSICVSPTPSCCGDNMCVADMTAC